MRAVLLSALLCLGCQVILTQQRATPASCTLWVDVIWKLVMLDENAPGMVKADFVRFIAFMDFEMELSPASEPRVDFMEFTMYWKCTLMSEEDMQQIFNIMARKGIEHDPDNDPTVIDTADIDLVWDHFGGDELSKEVFGRKVVELVGQLPGGGCEVDPGPNNQQMREQEMYCRMLLYGGF